MIVFHGTGHYAFEAISQRGLLKRHHSHVPKPCACTSLDIEIAKLFAVRKSTAEDFMAGKLSGIVLEFELSGRVGRDYLPVCDYRSLQTENEIAVFSPRRLQLLAVWRHEQDWQRHSLKVNHDRI